MRIRFFIIILLCVVIGQKSIAQQQLLDSLEYQLKIETAHLKKVDLLNHLSALYSKTDRSKAMDYATRALTISNNVNYPEGIAESYNNIGVVHNLLLEYEKALESHLLAHKLYVGLDDKKKVIETLNYLGMTHEMQDVYDFAEEYYGKAMAQAQAIRYEEGIATTRSLLGGLYLKKDDNIKALEYYLSALNAFEKLDDANNEAACLKSLGTIYREMGNNEMALNRYIRALELFGDAGNHRETAAISHNIGSIYYDRADYAIALNYYQISLDIRKRINDYKGLIFSYNMISDLYTKQQQYDKAIEYLNKALVIVKEKGLELEIKSIYENLSHSYANKSDYQNAYKYAKLYYAIKDSKETTELQAKLDAESKAREIELLNKENEMRDLEIRNKEILTYTVSGAFILLCALLLFLYRSLKQKGQVNADLQKAKERAEASEQVKEKFLAYTSHEIRTPLNAVVAMSALIAKTDLNETQQRHVGTIRSSAENMLVIVNDILDLSKMESGMMEFESIDFMLSEVVKDVIRMLHFKADEKGLKLVADIDKNIPHVLKGDPVRLNQVILNLASNALKFTDRGEVTVKAKLVEQDERGAAINIQVRDTGRGIPQEKLSTIFKRFKQVSKETSRKFGGSGLGLAITKQIIEQQGGDISVTSKLNKGTIFSINLRFKIGNKSMLEYSKQKDEAYINQEVASLKLLLVDDNMLNQEVISDQLRDWNKDIKVDIASNGKEAIEKLEQNNYGIVLMDVQMPEMDGFEATRHIRKKIKNAMRNVPIIAMTAHALDGTAEKCIESGMNDYVSKPIDTNKLFRKINRLSTKTNGINKDQSSFKIVNLSHLEKLTNNDSGKIKKYIDIFLKNTPQDLKVLHQMLEEDNHEELGKTAHKMKSGIAYMGIKEVEMTLARIEECRYKKMDKELLTKMVKRVDQFCSRAVFELNIIKKDL